MEVLFRLRNRYIGGSNPGRQQLLLVVFFKNSTNRSVRLRGDYTSPRFTLNRSLLVPFTSSSERAGNRLDCSRESFGDHSSHQ